MSAALVLRGYASRPQGKGRSWGVDYRKCLESHREHLIKPLVKKYGRLDLILVTYKPDLPDEFFSDYMPDILVKREEGPTQRQTALFSLDLVIEAQRALGAYELVVMTRFDVKFHQCPLELPNYDPEKVNFLWREWNEASWKDHKRVPDAFHAFPGRFVEGFRESVSLAPSEVCLHLIYYPLARTIGEENLNVMNQEGYIDSNTDRMPNPVYQLVRM